jgi:hypothetical protein
MTYYNETWSVTFVFGRCILCILTGPKYYLSINLTNSVRPHYQFSVEISFTELGIIRKKEMKLGAK